MRHGQTGNRHLSPYTAHRVGVRRGGGMTDPVSIPPLAQTRAAGQQIKLHIQRTPIPTSRFRNDLIGNILFSKSDNLQKAAVIAVALTMPSQGPIWQLVSHDFPDNPTVSSGTVWTR